MRLAGLLLLQIILLAAVSAMLSQVTGPLSLKPVVTGALLAKVWAKSFKIKNSIFKKMLYTLVGLLMNKVN